MPCHAPDRHREGHLDLVVAAARARFHPPALWQCGLAPLDLAPVTPSAFCHIPDRPNALNDRLLHLSRELCGRRVLARCWTDGSCLQPAHPRLRRAGWAVVFGGVWEELSCAAPLAGPVQTGFRAELRAIVEAVERAGGYVHCVMDV